MRRLAMLLTVCAIVFAPTVSATAAVRIAKIRYNPPGPDTGENSHINKEFVVIKNTGAHRIALTDWSLHDKQGHVYRFPRFRLRPGKTVTIHTGRGRDDRDDLYWEQSLVLYIWNNDGDTATLKDAKRHVRDRCHYRGGGTSVNC